MGSRGTMNEDVSIRYNGDDKNFKQAVDRVNVALKKQAALVEEENAKMESSYNKTGAAAAAMIAVFATTAVMAFFKNSIKLASDFAEAGGNLSSEAKITLSRLEDISLEWEAIKIQIGEAILEGEGLFRIIDKIGARVERIRKHGLLAGLLVKPELLDQWAAERAMYDVDRSGNPLAPEAPRRTLTELKEQMKAAKELAAAEKARAKAAKEAAAAAEKELALREKLAKAYHKLIISPMRGSFEEYGKSLQKSYGGLAGGPVETINNVTAAMEAQSNMVNSLSAVFENMFLNIDKGFKGMIESLIEGIKKLVIELTAKAAVLMLIRTLFPMSFGVGATTQLMGMFGSKLFSGNLNHNTGSLSGMGSQSLNIGGEFVLRGADAYALVQRHSNVIGRGT